ncbi:MAG: class I SAM-dependent methyltransferase [Candidatus Heimdallarchaeota archaeon]|nr:MAG: class I SAM-dependent methyltransferase [Candidatus Heimdallarchaeota archaeon]
MEKSSLLSGGKHYDLLVDWEKRLLTEIPFLSYFLTNFQPPIRTILEVGCGTGRHAEILHKKLGYQVTGIDIEKTMIEEAKTRLPETEMLVHDFLDLKIFNQRVFDAIISLGNSVGLMSASSDFEGIIKRFAQLLRKPKGLLIFHLLNTSKERSGWSAPRSINTTEGEYIFLRGFSTSEKFVHPEILTLYRPKEATKWEMTSTGKANILRINQSKMISLLKKFDFTNIKVFGDYQKNIFQSSDSVDMIFVCES